MPDRVTIEPLDTDRIAAELADREAIRDCLARYARGMDMLEPDLVRSAYWTDARHNGTVQAGPRN